MAQIWKTIAALMLITMGLTILGAEAQGNGRDKKQISGEGVFYLGQERDVWRPLIQTELNLTEIRSMKSIFQLRTFDPEGAVFYGDTKNGEDWYVLAIKDGFALMQLSKEGTQISVMGGPKLNDGKWHTLEISNKGSFVSLVVDGTQPLIVGLNSKMEEAPSTGPLRLALGGILMSTEKMSVPFKPQMDGCIREGNWLNLSNPWRTEEDEMWPCLENIKPGSFFPGKGLVVFNTSAFSTQTEQDINIEFWGDFNDGEMDGTICSIKKSEQEPFLFLVANKHTKEVTLTFGDDKVHVKQAFRRLKITFLTETLVVHVDGLETARLSVTDPDYLNVWTMGSLSIGGLQGEDGAGTQFLTGCLEKILIQGKNLDMNFAATETSVYSYSCPA